jgi:5-methylcytosine-specific restriction endonuclease McrA
LIDKEATMTRITGVILGLTMALIGLADATHPVRAADETDCTQFKIDDKKSDPFKPVSFPQQCKARTSNGFVLPDPNCTPGAVNPSLTIDVLRNPQFRTSCVRSHATTEQEKNKTYTYYGIQHPSQNSGVTQICELDHLISLELGGADTLENIWPQCGPPNTVLVHRYFKEKDTVENYLAKQVRDGMMSLDKVQHGIASDWTQYLADARKACPVGNCR